MTDWNQVVDEHGPLVWRTAYRLLGNEADAADCYQETFAAALAFSRKTPVDHWPALLWRLTSNHAFNRLRQRVREIARAGSALEINSVASSQPGPEQSAQANELADWLRQSLAELPRQQAEVFWLTCIDGLSYQEAAVRIRVDSSNVGVLLHRARSRLRELAVEFADVSKIQG